MRASYSPQLEVKFALNGSPFSHFTHSKFTCSSTRFFGKAFFKSLFITAPSKIISIKFLLSFLFIWVLSACFFIKSRFITGLAFARQNVKCLFGKNTFQLLYLTKAGSNFRSAAPIFFNVKGGTFRSILLNF